MLSLFQATNKWHNDCEWISEPWPCLLNPYVRKRIERDEVTSSTFNGQEYSESRSASPAASHSILG